MGEAETRAVSLVPGRWLSDRSTRDGQGGERDRGIWERVDAEVGKHKCAGRLGGGHPRTRPDHLGGDKAHSSHRSRCYLRRR